jgi:hypothetical protein
MYSGKIAVPPGGGGIVIIEDLGVKRLQATKTLKLIFLVQTIQK